MITENMMNDVLRYIGIPKDKADEQIKEKVEESFKVLHQVATPKIAYQKIKVALEGDKVILQGMPNGLQSRDLVKLLKNSKSCFIMAATLGIEVDRKIANLQKIDILQAMIIDACASVLIDDVCDQAEIEIMNRLEAGQYLTMRFSPGYGDVPLEFSEEILDMLMAQKRIGLTLTKTHILLPTKSITALIGLSNQKENRQKSCGHCNLVKTCIYRRRGERCGL